MSIGWRKTWKCDLCGHYWLVVGGDTEKVPRQCPKCRKTRWHTTGDFTGAQSEQIRRSVATSAPAVEAREAKAVAGPWDKMPITLSQFVVAKGRTPSTVQEWEVFSKWGR